MPVGGGRRAARIANPLATIAIFLTLCEITSGIAATLTADWVRGAFTLFSVLFPVLVASGLFAILWKKPEVLYAPGDYSSETSIRAYVDAVRGTDLQQNIETQKEALKDAVVSAVESIIVKYGVAHGAKQEDPHELARAVVEEEIRKRSIIVELPAADGRAAGGELLEIPVGSTTSVANFLNSIYFGMRGRVNPFTYGEEWLLFDRSSGRHLADIGTAYAEAHLDAARDDRPLARVGISPGGRLSVRLIGRHVR